MAAGNEFVDPQVGLCAECRHDDIVRSPRSTFHRCRRSFTDTRFPKYPRLPVVDCIGFEDILDVARGPSGKIRLERLPIDLADVVRRALDGSRHLAADKRLRLDVDVTGPLPIFGDASRLQQVVGNLLSNAIEFTPAGGTVSVAAGADNGEVWFTVKGTGIGIAPEFLPHVFDEFRQADAPFTRKYAGLGLATVEQLVQRHRGTVCVESPGPGQGARFTVRLPVRKESAGM